MSSLLDIEQRAVELPIEQQQLLISFLQQHSDTESSVKLLLKTIMPNHYVLIAMLIISNDTGNLMVVNATAAINVKRPLCVRLTLPFTD